MVKKNPASSDQQPPVSTSLVIGHETVYGRSGLIKKKRLETQRLH